MTECEEKPELHGNGNLSVLNEDPSQLTALNLTLTDFPF